MPNQQMYRAFTYQLISCTVHLLHERFSLKPNIRTGPISGMRSHTSFWNTWVYFWFENQMPTTSQSYLDLNRSETSESRRMRCRKRNCYNIRTNYSSTLFLCREQIEAGCKRTLQQHWTKKYMQTTLVINLVWQWMRAVAIVMTMVMATVCLSHYQKYATWHKIEPDLTSLPTLSHSTSLP